MRCSGVFLRWFCGFSWAPCSGSRIGHFLSAVAPECVQSNCCVGAKIPFASEALVYCDRRSPEVNSASLRSGRLSPSRSVIGFVRRNRIRGKNGLSHLSKGPFASQQSSRRLGRKALRTTQRQPVDSFRSGAIPLLLLPPLQLGFGFFFDRAPGDGEDEPHRAR